MGTGADVVVCVDAGTTVIKAVAFDATGRARATVESPAAVTRPAPGRSEQDMRLVWDAVAAAVRAVVAGLTVRALAVTAQGDGAWLVDASGAPVRPAVLWNDARGGRVIEAWRRDGVLDEAFRRTGSLGGPGLPHAILTVLRDEEPAVLARAAAVLTCGSWLLLRLTGTCGLDRSEASAPWLSRQGGYGGDLLDLYGLADLAHLLPPLIEGHDRVRPLCRAAAQQVGLPEGVPVVLAPYDIAATAIGAGAVDRGQAVAVLGTTLCPEAMIDPGADPGEPGGLTLDLGRWPAGGDLGGGLGGGLGGDRGGRGLHLRAFPTLAGTGVLDWAADLLGATGAAEVVALAADAPAGAGGAQLLPYLSPAGERAPFLDPAARGVLTGLTFDHGPAHLARAVLEGLAHVITECLAAGGVADGDLRLCGGGAASTLWTQVIADVTGRATVRTTDTQVGAKGALLVAATALGDHPDLAAAAAALVRVADRHEPDPAARDLHRAAHERFRATREQVAAGWDRWGNAGG